jgi:hypothetical protein
MATKIYKSAMGRVVDMGALMLENENTRAIGNMKVNARGDKIDVANKVTETKNKQVQRHYRQQQVTNTTEQLPTTSTRAAKQQQAQKKSAKEKVAKDTNAPVSTSRAGTQRATEKVVNKDVLEPIQEVEYKLEDLVEALPEIESMEELAELEATIPELVNDPVIEPITEPAPVEPTKAAVPRGGLAAAMAKSQSVKQELMKTQRQLAQGKPGVNKI